MKEEVKKKILFVLLQLDAGGSERVVLDLARNLDPLLFDVYIAAFKDGVLKPKFKEVCKEVFFIDKKTGFDLSAMVSLSKIISQNKIDVVNAHHYMPCFYSLLGSRLLNRKRLIYTEHSVPEVEGIYRGKHGIILNVMLFWIDLVIGVSDEISNTFKRCYPRHIHKFLTILNGVDIGAFSGRLRRNEVRNQFGLSSHHFVVGTVANFRKVKNHACIIRSMVRLKDDYPELRLMFVGVGFSGDKENSEEDIRRMVNAFDLEDRVIMTGYQDDIPAMLTAFDVFCLPSFSEGLPVSVLEAMASDLVVIGSDVSGISEVVVDKKTGFLFDSDDDKALSRLIEKIYKKKYDYVEMGINIKSTVEKRYCKKVWLKKIQNIFRN